MKSESASEQRAGVGRKSLTEALSTKPAPKREADAQADPRVADSRALLERCQRELAGKPEPDRAGRLHYEMAILYEGALDDVVRAADHYQKAANLAPDHAPSVRGARRALVAAGKYRAALPLFESELRLTGTPAARAQLLYMQGRILEDQLGQFEEALSCYRHALELEPNEPSILMAAQRVERATGQWAQASESFAKLAASAEEDATLRASLTAARARIAEQHLADEAKAAELFAEALELAPTSPGALTALQRISYRRGHWRDLLRALELRCERASDPATRAAALTRMALVHSEALSDVEQAVASLEAAIRVQPGDASLLRSLATLYERCDRYDAATDILGSLFALLTDPDDRLAVASRIGRLAETRLGDSARARTWYEAALGVDPGFEPVCEALAKLYAQEGQWQALVKMHLGRAEATENAAVRAAAHSRVGEILELELGRVDEAAVEHARALAYMPRHEASFKALVRLHTAVGRHRELIELYERAVDRETDETTALAYLMRVGAIYEDHLDDPQGAVHAYERALKRERDHLPSLQALQRAAARAREHQKLVNALVRESEIALDNERQVALLYRAAEVQADHLGNTSGALQLVRKVLDYDPQHVPSLQLAARLYRADGRWETLMSTWETELEATLSATLRVRLLHEMGSIAEKQLGKPKDAIERYRAALQEDPAHRPSFDALERLLVANRDSRSLQELYEQQIPTRKDPRERARLAYELGRLCENDLKDTEAALSAYERALQALPSFSAAADARIRLLEEQKAWKRLVEALGEEAGRAPDNYLAAEVLLRQAAIYADELHDVERAVESYEKVLEVCPGHLGALLHLEGLYLQARKQGSLEKVYRAMADSVEEPAFRVAVLRELARAQGPSKSLDTFESILHQDQSDIEALHAILVAARAIGDRETELGAESRLAAAISEPSERALHQARAAELLELRGELPAARDAYRQALETDPDNMAAVRGYSRVARALRDPEILSDAAEGEAKVVGDGDMAVELLLIGAEVRRGRGEQDRAAADLERALYLGPSHPEVWRKLSETLTSMGRREALIDHLSRAAEKAERPIAAEMQTTVARLYTQTDPAAAFAAVERALAAMPTHLPALYLRAELQESTQQWKAAAETLRRLVQLSSEIDEQLKAHYRLAAIADEHLGDAERALASLKVILDERPNDRSALSRMGRIYARLDRKEEAREIASRLVELSSSTDEQASALVDLARVELACGRPADAARAFLRAIALVGPGGRACTAYEQLVARAPDHASWDGYIQALRSYSDRMEAEGRSSSGAVLAIASVYADKLDRMDKALPFLRDAMRQHPDDVGIRLDLARRTHARKGYDESLETLRGLVLLDPRADEAYRLIAEAQRELGNEDEARAALAPLKALEVATERESATADMRALHTLHVPAGLFGQAGMREVQIGGCLDASAAAFVGALEDLIAKIRPFDPSRYGVAKRDRLRPGHAVRDMLDQLSNVFGAPEVDAYLHEQKHNEVTVELGNPVSLMVPSWALRLTGPQLVFLLARPMALAARSLAPVALFSPAELAALLTGAVRLMVPGFGGGEASESEIAARQRDVEASLGWLSRRGFEGAVQSFAASPTTQLAQWSKNVRLSAARSALLVSDDLLGSARLSATVSADFKDEAFGDLLAFWVSDAAVRFRRAAHQRAR